jgi:hypothetical protein
LKFSFFEYLFTITQIKGDERGFLKPLDPYNFLMVIFFLNSCGDERDSLESLDPPFLQFLIHIRRRLIL